MSSWTEVHSQEILELARKHGMTNVRVFRSMIRGEVNRTSNPDLSKIPLRKRKCCR